MTIFYHESPSNPCKLCKFLSSILKDAFFNCYSFKRSLSFTSREDEEESSTIFFNDEQEVVLKSKARAMEAKLRRKSIQWDESYSSVFYPVTLSELFVKTSKREEKKQSKGEIKQLVEEHEINEDKKEEFLSVASHFSCCSCAASIASEFFSVNTSFSSHCLSFKETEIFAELKRRSIIHEFSHCEGWPFGLCKRAMLLPPLPKSPSDSWLWCKSGKIRQDKLIA